VCGLHWLVRILVSLHDAISNTYFRIIHIIVFVQSRMLSLIDRVPCMHERSATTPHLAHVVFSSILAPLAAPYACVRVCVEIGACRVQSVTCVHRVSRAP